VRLLRRAHTRKGLTVSALGCVVPVRIVPLRRADIGWRRGAAGSEARVCCNGGADDLLKVGGSTDDNGSLLGGSSRGLLCKDLDVDDRSQREFGGGLWEMVASTGIAFRRADLSRGLSAAEVRRRAVWWRWRLAATAGCFYPRCPRVNRWASMYRCVGELSRVSRLVLLVSGQVKGSVRAHPSRYR
jgi:hypothetical protein